MKNLLNSTGKRVFAIVIALAVVLGGAAGGLFGYFSAHALPGSMVGSVDVGGMDREQVKAAVSEHFDNQSVTVAVPDGTVDTVLADAGLTIDVDKTVEAVFSQPILPGLFGAAATEPVIVVDEEAVAALAAKLPLPKDAEVVESSVFFDEATEEFVVKKGSSGKAIDIEQLQQGLLAVAKEEQSGTIEVGLLEVEPRISAADAGTVADNINQWLDVPITITDDEADTESADTSTRAAWVKVEEKDGALIPSIDVEAAKAWVSDYAEYTEVAPVTGLRNVDSSGEVVAVSLPPSDGWTVSNKDKIAQSIADSLGTQKAVEGVFEYAEDKAKWEDREAAAGSEDMIYRPAADEKWIDLNLSNATVTAYVGTEVVAGPFYMVPGAPETPTIEGEFNVYLKYELQDMRGENADGSKYLTKDVPWVSYFYGGYGFHGAPWRSSFGWNGPGGSHGCVNMPVTDAKYIYDWADMGTKVISHY